MVAVGRLGHLELILAQENREDRLDLHLREGRADRSGAGRRRTESGPAVDDVLLARLVVSARVERVGIREVLGDAVGNGRRGRHQVALVDRVALDLELTLCHPHQDDQRRVQAQGSP